MLAGILNDWKMSFRELETKRSSRSLEVIPDAEEEEDFDGVGLGDAEGGAGWLRGPEEAGLEAEEKGSTDGAPCELLPGAEVATATNLPTAEWMHQNGLLRSSCAQVTGNVIPG